MSDYNPINPYNFFPLGSGKTIANKEVGKLSGCIEYSILTKSPLFIPGTCKSEVLENKKNDIKEDDSNKEKIHYSYDFFECNKEPVIPGSEVRGMIRSNYEILTNSCLSIFDENEVLVKRSPQIFEPCLLRKEENNKYSLFKANSYKLRLKNLDGNALGGSDENGRFVKSHNTKILIEGQKIFFKYNNKRCVTEFCNIKKTNEYSEGYIIKGENGPVMSKQKNNVETDRVNEKEKHCIHVFKVKERSCDVDIKLLDRTIEEYQKLNENAYKEYRQELEKFKNGPINSYFPVYYSEVNEEKFISPASITKEVFSKKAKDLIKGYESCLIKKEECPACKVFGNLKVGNSSKLRFTDAKVLKKEEWYEKERTLEPLASPKINNMPFYMKRPNGSYYWTWGYSIYAKGNIKNIGSGLLINGRKFYWHSFNYKNSIKDNKTVEKTNLNITIKPLKSGIYFNGKVYFEGLTNDELNTLIYVLNCGNYKNDKISKIEEVTNGYKIGGGKPLGLGSIAQIVNSVKIKQYDISNSLSIIEKDYIEYEEPKCLNENLKKNYSLMTSFKPIGEDNNARFDYPKDEQDKEIFEWFANNTCGRSFKRNDKEYKKYLEPLKAKFQSVENR